MSDQPIHKSNIPLFVSLPVGVGTNISPSQEVQEAISYCVQVIWSNGSSMSGSIYLEASNDNVNFTQIPQTILAISGASGSHMINIEKHAYGYVHLVVNLTAGSATIDSRMNAKRK
jgi:hypothetical protein